MSVARKLAIAAFVVATLALALWLFVSWFVYDMSSFECMEFGPDARECAQAAQKQLAIAVLPAAAFWVLIGWLAFREWKRS